MKLATILIAFAYAVSAKFCEIDYIASHMNMTETDVQAAKVICENCMKEYNVPLASLKQVELTSNTTPSCSIKCYYKCYFQKYGSMDLEGNWIPSAVEGKMSQENFQAALSCIGHSQHDDLCEKAYGLYACYVKLIGKHSNSL